ncbi:polysaccharide biosynthesis protein : Polysaccharide biosynthesis protein OS=Pirellula staleyi (strain ATCC 27377 / DSM 6068 / ICPB 4128) GN=Psta_1385 PE=4 SV=1: DNA_pol_B_exo2 [Gemmataceae bacterium]|nr:polysaccharide biosynthesis protein : Polysaccharide biosynthesis protein OS=Pirellula staleyi (strain ATCC 27377 / DSM 6068 / ICPB 4128) GN=Psta_1385 PE=4 SV=1: DNA_pol_B_exo2 [Gemmataceae bacterium]VTU00640.1 polysaccharide biosynthesis protein : Polysaccharide biosynthesis protein OS=Pirellula staleyi (strain ATCC 27377 / DSM 6068 / ICPB 4128) GN=Psta_1385 PE=4 SV=1: DNA_pol_B_exo2 [Gemmataceae bacterium]
MALADTFAKLMTPDAPAARTAFLIVDTESVPDGKLLAAVKYPGENLTPEAAVERARSEARESSGTGSDFLPVTFQVPVGVCVLRVGADFALQSVACLDAPHFRPREIVNKFWLAVSLQKAKLVTFNGRAFDLPLMELAAFRYGFSARDYYQHSRNRFNGPIDLCDWLTNFGASRMAGGLNLLAKLLGKPGKMDVTGGHVYQLYREVKLQEVNDYCLCDTLDTYFVFLRTRVLTGEIDPDQEAQLVARAREFLAAKCSEFPVLRKYLDNWTDFTSM